MNESKKKQLFFIDTNIFLRVLVKEDETTFNNCLNFLRLISDKKIKAYTSTVVLIEVNFVLSSFYKFPKEKVIEALQSIMSLSGLKIIDDYNLINALEFYTKYQVKFIDCLFASSSLLQKDKASLISFDNDFKKLGLKKIEPQEILGLF